MQDKDKMFPHLEEHHEATVSEVSITMKRLLEDGVQKSDVLLEGWRIAYDLVKRVDAEENNVWEEIIIARRVYSACVQQLKTDGLV